MTTFVLAISHITFPYFYSLEKILKENYSQLGKGSFSTTSCSSSFFAKKNSTHRAATPGWIASRISPIPRLLRLPLPPRLRCCGPCCCRACSRQRCCWQRSSSRPGRRWRWRPRWWRRRRRWRCCCLRLRRSSAPERSLRRCWCSWIRPSFSFEGRRNYRNSLNTQMLLEYFNCTFLRCCRFLLFSSLSVLSRSRLDWCKTASLPPLPGVLPCAEGGVEDGV